MIANIFLTVLLAIAALTLIAVGLVRYIARTRAVMTGGFWIGNRHFTVIEDWLDTEVEIEGEVVFSSALDDYHGGNIDRWRGTAHR